MGLWKCVITELCSKLLHAWCDTLLIEVQKSHVYPYFYVDTYTMSLTITSKVQG
jgi:hypothetical protein